jgi:hypothetical protein
MVRQTRPGIGSPRVSWNFLHYFVPGPLAHKLESSEGVYVLRTSTDLRIFFSLHQDQIVVLDIARKGTIMSFGPLAEQSRS